MHVGDVSWTPDDVSTLQIVIAFFLNLIFFLARLLVALVKVRHGELADHGHLDHPALGLVACWREPPATSLVAVLLLLLLLLILEAKLTIIVLE